MLICKEKLVYAVLQKNLGFFSNGYFYWKKIIYEKLLKNSTKTIIRTPYNILKETECFIYKFDNIKI